MISFKDAQKILYEQKQHSNIMVSIEECAGYVAGETIYSDVFVPSFINSAVDGFAVRSCELETASSHNKIELNVVGRTMAGDICDEGNQASGSCVATGAWEIMTGACVPTGYDAVVPVEQVEVVRVDERGVPLVVCFQQPISGQVNGQAYGQKTSLENGSKNRKTNIRLAGEDYKPNHVIVEKGDKLTSTSILALSAIGKTRIPVVRKPNVTLFSSGNEVVSNFTDDLHVGQIRDANGPYLKSVLNETGLAKTKFAGVLADDVEQFKMTLLSLFEETDIFISTGGVSAGRYDFIPDALKDLGAEILFHKVAIRPGKPLLYARFSNGKHYFGLPGNPISAAVGFRFFVLPLLRHLQFMAPEAALKARLTKRVMKNHALQFFAKSKLRLTPDVELVVDILDGQDSFKTHPLLKSNCWSVFKKDDYVLDSCDVVDVYPLIPGCLDLTD